MRERNGMDLDGRGSGEELGGEETKINMYYVRVKKNLFSIKRKTKK